MAQENNKNLLFNIFVALIMALLAYRDLASHAINIYFLVAIMSVPYILLDAKQSLAYTCFLFPMMGGVIPYYLGVGLIMLYIKYGKSLTRLQIVPFVILIVLESIQFFNTPTTHKLPELLSYFAAIGLFFLLPSINDESIDKKSCIRWFIYGVSFEFVLILARSYFVNGDFSALLESRALFNADEEVVNQFFEENPTSIALYSITIFSILILGRNKIEMGKLLYILSFVICLFGGACTISRMWLIDIFFVLLLFVISRRKKTFFYLGLILFAGVIWFSYFGDSEINALFQARMHDETISTAGGRTDLWTFFNEKMFSNVRYIPFGVGAYEYPVVFNSGSPHNGIQQLFVCYGLMGLILFTVYAVKYSKLIGSRFAPFEYHIPFFAVFLFLQSTQFCMPYRNMTPMIIVLLFLRLYSENNGSNAKAY